MGKMVTQLCTISKPGIKCTEMNSIFYFSSEARKIIIIKEVK